MNKKGFTLIEMIAVIALLSLVVSIATYTLTTHLSRSRDKSFALLVNSMEDSVLEAYTACLADSTSSSFCTNHPIKEAGVVDQIYLSELINGNYIESIKNPWKNSENCDANSYVKVSKSDSSSLSFDYKTCLICGTHTSSGCNN